MRRLVHWILAMAGSAILLVAVTSWIWSFWRRGCIDYCTSSSFNSVVADKGTLWIIQARFDHQIGPSFDVSTEEVWPMPFVSERPQLLGFYAWRDSDPLNLISDKMGLGVPFWFLTLLSFAIAARGWWMISRHALRNLTSRKSCGYDLRAGHDKCPECGGESHVRVGAAVG